MTSYLKQIYNTVLSDENRKRLHKLRHINGYRKLRTEVFPSEKGDFSLKPYDDHHCIFIHITKTAGTSVAKSLFNYLPYHYTAIDYRVIYGTRTYDRYFKFAFVRNPWDRLYSAYRYFKAGGWNDDDKTWARLHLAPYKDFNSFVQQWLTPENIKKHIHFKPQCEFICDSENNIIIDYLAYFETIDDDFDAIAARLGIDTQLGQHNTNPAVSYTTVYEEKSAQIVAQLYADDIIMFGYGFNGIKNRRTLSQK